MIQFLSFSTVKSLTNCHQLTSLLKDEAQDILESRRHSYFIAASQIRAENTHKRHDLEIAATH